MSVLLNSYYCLLTDIRRLSGVPIGIPDDLSINWVLKEGPSLDKSLLNSLKNETNSHPGDDIRSLFPDWLLPLWLAFYESRNPYLLKLLRQLLVFGYKSRLEPTHEQQNEAIATFINTEREVRDFDSSLTAKELNSPFWRTARSIVSRVTARIDWSEVIPQHGPGAVFPSIDHSLRSDFCDIYETIETKYPFFEYFIGLRGFVPASADEYRLMEPKLRIVSDITCKLCMVPKDSRGPRLISVHPREAIWIQQGQRRLLEQAMVRCRPFISLNDQTINGSLALSSSDDQEFATLDLSEASDRLSCRTVRHLFGDFTYDWLSCSRASKIKMPDNSVMDLHKWAPMGNALCFPVESLSFWAIVRAGITVRYGSQAASNVYVFGDDIIVPTCYYGGAVDGLKRAGLVVNTNKSFNSGFFRESCGVDAYRGINVTPHRIKKHEKSCYSDLDSMCALAKNMRIQGFEDTASALYNYVRSAYRYLSLTNNPRCNGIVEFVDRDLAFLLRNEKSLKWDNSLHKFKTKSLLPSASMARVSCYWYNIQDSILRLERSSDGSATTSSNASGGLEYPVPHRTRYKMGWIDVIMK
jgi:hypothetical protein